MKASYRAMWSLFFLGVFACAYWVFDGAAAARRLFWSATRVDDAARTETRFVAVCFPRLTENEEPFSLSGRRFRDALEMLRAKGYVTIGLADVRDLFERGRLLPPKSLLISLDRDDPTSLRLADDALKSLRMRGLVFVDRNGVNDPRLHRYALSPHARVQLAKSGAWDFGWFADSAAAASSDARLPVLDLDGKKTWTRDRARFPMRFVGARHGYNDLRSGLDAINLMTIRPELSAEDIAFSIEAAWPRDKSFADDFQAVKLGMDWVADWGVISAGHGRLAVLPLPRQTGASVFLSGTEDWRDLALEFEVRKYQRAFWAYARDGRDGSYVRIGLNDGYWYVQEKRGASDKPVSLAREPVRGLPARVRVVLKDRFAVVDLDGRLAFRRGVELSTDVDHGRVSFGVFDHAPRSAMGILSYVRARPIGRRWLSLNVDGTLGDFDPEASERLREESVFSFALSPRWLSIAADGRVERVGRDPDFVRHLAGFNRCLLVPMAFLSSSRLAVVADPTSSSLLVEKLSAAADDLRADGLNIRLPGPLSRKEEALRFVTALSRRLHERDKRLWVTFDGPVEDPGAWVAAVDGVLRPGARPVAGVEQMHYLQRSKD